MSRLYTHAERERGRSDADRAVPRAGHLRVRLRAPSAVGHGDGHAGQLPAAGRDGPGGHRVRPQTETAQLRHRQLLSLQGPEHHHLLPERGPQAPVLRDRQAVRHAGDIPVSHLLRAPAKTRRPIVTTPRFPAALFPLHLTPSRFQTENRCTLNNRTILQGFDPLIVKLGA